MSIEQYPIPREQNISDQDMAMAALAPGGLSFEQALGRVERFDEEIGGDLRAINNAPRNAAIGLAKGALAASAFLTIAANPAETKEFAENLDKISPEASKEIVNVAAGVIAGTLATIKELGESTDVGNWPQIVGNAVLGGAFGYFSADLVQSIPEIKSWEDLKPLIEIPVILASAKYLIHTTDLQGRIQSTKGQFSANRQQRDDEIEYRQLVNKTKSWNLNTEAEAETELRDRGYTRDKKTGEWV